MNLKSLYTDDDAVSPVIGVILMVAITVILAAVIGTFVLGLGQNLNTTAPTASITFDQSAAANNQQVTISHDGGDSLDESRISIQAPGSLDGSPVDSWGGSNDEITAGETITIDNSGNGYTSGDTIKVVWTSNGGGSSSVLGEYKVE